MFICSENFKGPTAPYKALTTLQMFRQPRTKVRQLQTNVRKARKAYTSDVKFNRQIQSPNLWKSVHDMAPNCHRDFETVKISYSQFGMGCEFGKLKVELHVSFSGTV